MGLFEDCEEYFNTRNLYEILGVSCSASDAQLKKAYKKSSLLYHPDRVTNDKKDEATKKFQILSKVHNILTDKEKRVVYDEAGCIDEENLNLEKDWCDYWRLLFPKVTKNDIDAFMKKYKGSKEELEDLKKCYLKYEGDMNKISESFMGYDINEEHHYRQILTELIEKKEIPDFPKFSKETKSRINARKKKYTREAEEAEKVQSDMDSSLVNAIVKRSEDRENQFNDMIKNLEAKYAKPAKKKRGSKEELEDLKKCYLKYEGDRIKSANPSWDMILMKNTTTDKFFRELIEKKEIPDFPKFSKETKSRINARKKKYTREAEEAEKVQSDMDSSLVNAIVKRSEDRENQFNDMIKNLEAKYAKPAKKKRGK